MGKEQCAICGKEKGAFEKFATAGPEFGEAAGKPICWQCKNKQIKKETNEAVGEKAVKFEGQRLQVVQIPIAFTEGAWDKVDKILAQGYTIKGVVEQELIHASLVIMEKKD